MNKEKDIILNKSNVLINIFQQEPKNNIILIIKKKWINKWNNIKLIIKNKFHNKKNKKYNVKSVKKQYQEVIWAYIKKRRNVWTYISKLYLIESINNIIYLFFLFS